MKKPLSWPPDDGPRVVITLDDTRALPGQVTESREVSSAHLRPSEGVTVTDACFCDDIPTRIRDLLELLGQPMRQSADWGTVQPARGGGLCETRGDVSVSMPLEARYLHLRWMSQAGLASRGLQAPPGLLGPRGLHGILGPLWHLEPRQAPRYEQDCRPGLKADVHFSVERIFTDILSIAWGRRCLNVSSMVAPAFKELIFNQRGLIKDPYKCYKTREEQNANKIQRGFKGGEDYLGGSLTWRDHRA